MNSPRALRAGVAALIAGAVFCAQVHPARADDAPPPQHGASAPEGAPVTAAALAPVPPAPSASGSSEPMRVFGGLLLGISSASAVAATITGGFAIATATDTGATQAGPAALGLALGAALTAAIGIPLLVAGTNQARAARKASVNLSFAPMLSTQQGSGAVGSLTVRF